MSRASLEHLYETFLGDPDGDFAAFCGAHPDHAAALRTYHAWWQEVEGARDRGMQASTLAGTQAGRMSCLADIGAQDSRHAHYVVEEEIGRGGMGVVYRVRDGRLERHLAMKVASNNSADSSALGSDPPALPPTLLARFLEEAQVTAQLDHPGIVPIHELSVDDRGRVFFTMRLVRGETLERVFDQLHRDDGDRNLAGAVRALLVVCQAVAYAHARGVLHRDLKPQNVMVGEFGEVYVMDWGLARVRAAAIGDAVHSDRQVFGTAVEADDPLRTRSGDVLGTPSYMPPEQASGDLDALGPAADVYAIGAMLYHLLSGHPPYADAARPRADAVLDALRARPPVPLARLCRHAAPELIAISEKARARDPAARYGNAQWLGDDMAAWLEGRVVHAHGRGAWVTARKWMQRNRVLTAAMGALVLSIGVGIVVCVGLATQANARAAEARSMQADAAARGRAAAEVMAAFDVMAVRERILDARRAAARLVPAWPEHIAELARLLHEDVDAIEQTNERLKGLSLATATQSGEAIDAQRSRFLREAASALAGDVDDFLRADGTAAQVRRRLAWARSIQVASIDSHRAAWNDAIAAIARGDGRTASDRYRGLVIAPQMGLVPLGMDPDSKLWEFVDLASGQPGSELPVRGGDHGWLQVTPQVGMVLVLIPGGVAVLGAQATELTGQHYDASAQPNEGPVHEIDLVPFFLAKHELTRAQWQRLSGAPDPSWYKTGDSSFMGGAATVAHPVESVAWTSAAQVLHEHGLALPTEAQWEYACRASTHTPWSTGQDAASLAAACNLLDAITAAKMESWGRGEPFDDGVRNLAVPGRYRPNGFGLHDMHGNVDEWCADTWLTYGGAVRPGDGLRFSATDPGRVLRGGSFRDPATGVRSAHRGGDKMGMVRSHFGVRAARAVLPLTPLTVR